ncbi:MAG: hypothetical protein EP330_11400 [Deltaproteobacteria bacterium]|nr:MAG: hypothetical protein EP330_11400 [Deltaproteobacteria bacterium]
MTALLLAAALAAPLPKVDDDGRWFTAAARLEAVGRDRECRAAVAEAVEALDNRLARRGLVRGVYVDDEGVATTSAGCEGKRAKVTVIGVKPGGKRMPSLSAGRIAEVATVLGRSLASVRFEWRDGLWLVQETLDGGMGLERGDYAMLALVGDIAWMRAIPELAGMGVDLGYGDGMVERYRFTREDMEAFDAGAIDKVTFLARGRLR